MTTEHHGPTAIPSVPGVRTDGVAVDNPASRVAASPPPTFVRKLPNSAVQLIAIAIAYMNFDQPGVAHGDARRLGRQFIERIDWKALAEEGLK